ncbi:MAG: hypothetical protein ACREE4_18740 [Stellaceae bacterium]
MAQYGAIGRDQEAFQARGIVGQRGQIAPVISRVWRSETRITRRPALACAGQ